MKYLCIDTTNLLYRSFYAHKQEADDDIIGLAHHSGFNMLKKYFTIYKPDKIVLCFDRASWRKQYTKSDQCVTPLIYKGQRRQNMTPQQKQKFNIFINHTAEFEQIMRNYTSSICLAADGCEADDMLAIFTLMHSDDNEIIIVSGDKDMIQLMKYPNTIVVDPATGNKRTLTEWDDNVDYFLYEKFFRGDRSDNIQSALPRIRKTKIKQAFSDPYFHIELMEQTWALGDREFKVKELFEENRNLIDLERQPDDIKRNAIKAILTEIRNPTRFSHFDFIKFLAKHNLEKIKNNAEYYVKMLSC